MNRMIRRGLPVLAAGLALAGAVTVVSPASAATGKYQAILGFTTTRGDSVYLLMNDVYTCHTGFRVGVRKEIRVKVNPGQGIHVFSSEGCYNALEMSDVTITSDGQRADFIL